MGTEIYVSRVRFCLTQLFCHKHPSYFKEKKIFTWQKRITDCIEIQTLKENEKQV